MRCALSSLEEQGRHLRGSSHKAVVFELRSPLPCRFSGLGAVFSDRQLEGKRGTWRLPPVDGRLASSRLFELGHVRPNHLWTLGRGGGYTGSRDEAPQCGRQLMLLLPTGKALTVVPKSLRLDSFVASAPLLSSTKICEQDNPSGS